MRPVFAGVMAGLLVSLLLLFLLLAVLPPGPIARPTAPPPPTIPVITPPTLPTVGSPTPSAGSPGAPSASGSSASGGLQIGSVAPALRVARLGGGEIDSSQLAGTPLWINFTATWCPTCRDELRLLERYQEALKGKLTVVVVDVREPRAAIDALVRDLRLTLAVGLDETGAAQRDWAAYVLPVHYWLDATGHVRAWVYGGAGPDQFATGLHTVLPDANVDVGS